MNKIKVVYEVIINKISTYLVKVFFNIECGENVVLKEVPMF